MIGTLHCNHAVQKKTHVVHLAFSPLSFLYPTIVAGIGLYTLMDPSCTFTHHLHVITDDDRATHCSHHASTSSCTAAAAAIDEAT